MKTIPDYLRERAKRHLDDVALRYPVGEERREITYRELFDRVARFGRGLVDLGVKPGDRVYLLADNSPRWIVCDLGIMWAGAVCVPRAADTTPEESEYILRHSGARAVIAANPRQIERLPDTLLPLEVKIALAGDGVNVTSYEQVLERGGGSVPQPSARRLATIVYTSGTTGVPKGVMLEHENVLHNIRVLPGPTGIGPHDLYLSVLPTWHMFERTVEYCLLAGGATISYSSLRTLKKDLRSERPTLLAGVPRLFEGVYSGFMGKVEAKKPFGRALAKFLLGRALRWSDCRLRLGGRVVDERGNVLRGGVGALLGSVLHAPLGALGRRIVGGPVKQAVGGRMRMAISGGGLLPLHIDRFLNGLGVRMVVGYGLTETSPVAAVRSLRRNVLGTIGRALDEVELRITGPGGEPLPAGEVGELEIRGPNVMPGYYGDEDTTRNALREDGWFRSGDLCRMTPGGDVVFRGRQKETIVLSGWENIEPAPIEARILESSFVSQAMVVGQDRKGLAALIVPDPETAPAEAESRGVSPEELIRQEVRRLVSRDSGFKARELIGRIALLDHEFNIDEGTLTRTLKLRRPVILEKYKPLIDSLYE